MPVLSKKIRRKKEPLYASVANSLRSVVSSSKGGQMLPSERDLAEQYSVSSVTIRKVLDILSQEGHVQRFHGRGTVIVDKLQQGEFAIVMRPALLEAGASPFYRETARLLSEKIHEYNNQWSPRLHLGGKTNTGREYPATLDLLEPDVLKRLRGVFSFHPLYELGEQLRQKNIPLVYFGNLSKVCIVTDNISHYRESIKHLREIGCKTIGFLWAHYDRPLKAEERKDSFFTKCAVDAGFSTNEICISAIKGDFTERMAYDKFVEFWQQQVDRPDGIVIDDDMLIGGVLRAILHKQIRMPE